MPISHTKKMIGKRSLIDPGKFLKYRIEKEGKPTFKCPESVILCFSWKLFDHIIKNFKVRKVDGFVAQAYLMEDLAIFGRFGIGAPVSTILLEELIAYGAKKFIIIGNAGALQKNLKVGDLILCKSAIRDEGVSYHYKSRSKYSVASNELTRKLQNNLNKIKVPFHIGTSWTNDAFYRVTKEEVVKYQNEGVLTTEMEAASLFAVAEFRKVEIAAIFCISDSIANFKWKPGWHMQNIKSLEIAFKVAVKTLCLTNI